MAVHLHTTVLAVSKMHPWSWSRIVPTFGLSKYLIHSNHHTVFIHSQLRSGSRNQKARGSSRTFISRPTPVYITQPEAFSFTQIRQIVI